MGGNQDIKVNGDGVDLIVQRFSLVEELVLHAQHNGGERSQYEGNERGHQVQPWQDVVPAAALDAEEGNEVEVGRADKLRRMAPQEVEAHALDLSVYGLVKQGRRVEVAHEEVDLQNGEHVEHDLHFGHEVGVVEVDEFLAEGLVLGGWGIAPLGGPQILTVGALVVGEHQLLEVAREGRD